MNRTRLYIRNMCCSRCVEIVKTLFKNTPYKLVSVQVGSIEVQKSLTPADIKKLDSLLHTQNFFIADRHSERLVVSVHSLLCQYVRENISQGAKSTKLSSFIEKQMHRSYFHVSKLFSAEAGMTIERYFLLLKMERAKELLIEGVETISSIAYELGYSTSQIFSTQFKKETGKTPAQYRLNPIPSRTHWDKILPQHFKQIK